MAWSAYEQWRKGCDLGWESLSSRRLEGVLMDVSKCMDGSDLICTGEAAVPLALDEIVLGILLYCHAAVDA